MLIGIVVVIVRLPVIVIVIN